MPSIPLCNTANWNSTSTTVTGSTGTTGTTATLLNSPYDVSFDSYNYMYVVDYNNHRIQRYLPGYLEFFQSSKIADNKTVHFYIKIRIEYRYNSGWF